MRAPLIAFSMWVAASLVAGVAHAHPLIDQAVREYQDARFEVALETLSRAEQATDLSREDLVRLYLYRALIHSGLEVPAARNEDLLRLASLEPGYAFDERVPPVVREAFAEVRRRVEGPLGVEASFEATPGAARVEARVVDDPAGLARAVRVGVRAAGGQWVRSREGSVTLPAASGDVEWYAEAVGPGGAVLARRGSEEAPIVETVGGRVPATAGGADPLEPRASDEEGGAGPWPWVISGVLAAGIAAVVIVLVVGGGGASDVTRLDGPGPL